MKKCLNCGMEYQDDSLEFCECGGPLVEINNSEQRENEKFEVVGVNLDNYESQIPEHELEQLDQVELQESNEPEKTEDSPEIIDVIEEIEIPSEVYDESSRIIDFLEEGLELPNPDEIFGELEQETMKAKYENENTVEPTTVPITEESNSHNEEEEEVALQKEPTYEPITDKIVIEVYRNKRKVLHKELAYDEITIGRSKTGIDADINLRDFDDEKLTSRKHAKIFKENGTYYIVRISEKAPIYLNTEILPPNEPRMLKDGDKIVLSSRIGIITRSVN